MSSGRRQGGNRSSEPVAKRRRGARTRDSGSSSNGESSSVDRTQQPRQLLQQQQQRPISPVTVSSLPVVNPARHRLHLQAGSTMVAIPSRQSRPLDSDQIAPTSPQTTRRTASLHVNDQVAPDKPTDPSIVHQMSSLPKETFQLCSTDLSGMCMCG